MSSGKDCQRTLHVYRRLWAAGYTRLMHLEPALISSTPIRFSFQHNHLLGSDTHYEAVSYTWGEPKLTYPLFVDDDTCIMATSNLDRALRRLRHPTETRVLWVDAICINQSDDGEKAKQIPLMARIFRGASRVLGWLDGGWEEERGMRMLNELSRKPRGVRSEHELWQVSTKYVSESEWKQEFFRDTLFVRRFLNLAWFSRLWIVQEIVMNTDIVLICGTSEISWVRLITALDTLRNTLIPTMASIGHGKLEALLNITKLWRYHSMIAESQSNNELPDNEESILAIVDKFWSYECTDPRDRIFALYNMTSDIQATQSKQLVNAGLDPLQRIYMDVDYSSDTRQVYQTFATACIASERAIPLLNAVLSRQYLPSSEDWPSWVPDWRKPPSTRHVALHSDVSCNLVHPDKIAISLHRTGPFRDEEFLAIETIAMTPDLSGALASLLRKVTEGCPFPLLASILQNLLLDDKVDDHIFFAHYITGVLNINAPDFPSARVADITVRLHAAMRDQRFFTAISPTTAVRFMGYGNAALQKGDHIVPLTPKAWVPHAKGFGCTYALLVRPMAQPLETAQDATTPHQLIGSALISLPFRNGILCESLGATYYTTLYLG